MDEEPCFRDFACSEGCKSYKVCNIQILILWVMSMTKVQTYKLEAMLERK